MKKIKFGFTFNMKEEMNHINLLGIHGKYRSGKDVASCILREYFECSPYRYTFGIEVKRVVSIKTNHPIDNMETPEEKNIYIPKYKKTIGQLLQHYGEKYRNKYGEDIWIRKLENSIIRDHLIYGHIMFIISDVRYPNELGWVQKHGYVFRIEQNVRLYPNTRDPNHPSEISLDNITLPTINNNGDEKELKEKLLMHFAQGVWIHECKAGETFY
jgi:hypothetical protein